MSNSPGRVAAPVFFASLAELAASELVSAGIADDAQAAEIGEAIARRVAFDWGGIRLYVPDGTANGRSGRWFERQERDQQIIQLYTGRNISELCDRFGLHQATVRKILKRARSQPRVTSPLGAPTTQTMPAAPRVLSLSDQTD